MSDRKTTTIDGQVAYLIQYDEIPAYDELTWDPCTKCVCGPGLKERPRQGLHNCPEHAIPGCGGGLFLHEAEFAVARLGGTPTDKVDSWDDKS